ncbi:MAG: CehA/McbA family metallohydrolase [Planctomycetaceae bacterium]
MRWPAILTIVVMIGLLCVAGSRQPETCAVTLTLTDAASGHELSGLVRVTDSAGKHVAVTELLSRGLGLAEELGVAETDAIHRWSVLPRKSLVQLPRTKLTIEAISGLDTESATVTVDLADRATAEVNVALTRFDDLKSRGYRSANTHLHLMKISRADSDRYLQEVPKADGLDAVFLSYIERAVADREYTSNQYTGGDLASITRRTGVNFGNGEEHRHNMAGYGEGYGHVMLLNIKKHIEPVSIGPGIMKMGTDGIPLRRGIETARTDGATIVWCHNRWGMEDLPNLLGGRIDAQNIFDGSVRDSYKDSYYRYLNVGLHVPFSTGTDWFIYDFSRVYAAVEGDVTIESWLNALKQGRSFITNGPLLELRVADKTLGETIELGEPKPLGVIAKARGRLDFQRIELVRNGAVIASAASKPVGRHFEAELATDVQNTAPGWLALRTPPPPIKDDPALQQPVAKNELGRDLFAHTSPIYVNVAGKGCFDEAVARSLLAEMQANLDVIADKALFADPQERARVLDVHREGIELLNQRISQRGSQ